MKKLLFALLTIISFDSFSQAPVIKPTSKVALGFTFSPDYCYRILNADASSKTIVDDRNNIEIPKFGFTTGARILYTLGNRVSFESGLLFSDKGEKTKKLTYTTTEPDPAAPAYGQHNHHYLYLDIPAKVNYYLTASKVKLFVSTGVSTSIFLKSIRTSEYEYKDGWIESKTLSEDFLYSRVNLVALAGAGVDINLTNKLLFRAEPIYRRSVTSIINAPIKGYLTSAGINMGVFYQL